METITSRKNAYIRHVRILASDGSYRREQGEYLCDGIKTLRAGGGDPASRGDTAVSCPRRAF